MSDNSRITTLESEGKRMRADFDKLEHHVERRNQNHTEIMATLAVIINKQDDFKDYQNECNVARGAHESRINSLENINKTNKAVIVAVASLVSCVWAGITFLFSK